MFTIYSLRKPQTLVNVGSCEAAIFKCDRFGKNMLQQKRVNTKTFKNVRTCGSA